MKITYIEHSSFLLESEEFYLLFDYFQGQIPEMDAKKRLYVFSSHAHHDHFSFEVFKKTACMKDLVYIFSKDIKKRFSKSCFLKNQVSEAVYESIFFLKEYQGYEDAYIRVETLKSTDEGLAFIVESHKESIYHAGDLNWWSWQGESLQDAKRREESYKKEIDKLKGYSFDIAFLPLDPRQEDRFYKGFDYFAKEVEAKMLVPMHMWGDFSVIDKLKKEESSRSYREKISFP